MRKAKSVSLYTDEAFDKTEGIARIVVRHPLLVLRIGTVTPNLMSLDPRAKTHKLGRFLMAFGGENGRKRFVANTSVLARSDFERVSPPKVTEGAANPGHLFRLAP
jgi:hypothetical protein